jgi:hypothetical protein
MGQETFFLYILETRGLNLAVKVNPFEDLHSSHS